MQDDFLIEKHIKFLERYLSLLPSSHQDSDPNKLVIVFYAITGLYSLDHDIVSKYEANLSWLYKHYLTCTIPESSLEISGFIGSLSMDIPGVVTFSLTNTLFALLTFITMNDKHFFENILNIKSISNFVSKCQLTNGSFVSTLTATTYKPSKVDSSDLRVCYIAISILFLTGCRCKEDFNIYIDVDSLLKYVLKCKCFSGGFGSNDEAHSGHTSCALSLLSLLDCLDMLDENFKEKTITWLLERQVSNQGCMRLQDGTNLYYDISDNGGFQGRENKFADTCYSFWCLNSLQILTTEWKDLCDVTLVRKYLLGITQNKIIGGFSKTDEDRPDIFHTCMGIVALTLIDGTLNGELCLPKTTLEQFAIKFNK